MVFVVAVFSLRGFFHALLYLLFYCCVWWMLSCIVTILNGKRELIARLCVSLRRVCCPSCFHTFPISVIPSKHITMQQRRYNVAATSLRCSDVVTTLLGRCVGYVVWFRLLLDILVTTVEHEQLESGWLVYLCQIELVFESLRNSFDSSRKKNIWGNFLFYHKIVCYVFSLE